MKNVIKTRFAANALLISLGMVHATNTVEPQKPSTSVEAEKLHTYFWANYNQFRGNAKQASSWYQGMFDNNPPVHTYPGYILHLDETGNYQKIVELYPRVQNAVQDNPKIQLVYALALAQVGRVNASDEELVKLQSKFKGDKEVAFYTANKYLRSKEPENALSVIDDYLKITARKPQNFVFYFMKSQVYAQMNKYDEALANIKLALQLHPQFDKGWLMLALLEEQAGKIQEAIKGYTSYLEISSEPNKNIEQHLLQLALKQELAQQNKRMVILDPACFEKAAALFDRKQYRQALSTVNECLKNTPEHVELRLLKLRTLVAMEQPDEAVRTIAQWIKEKPNEEMWYKTLHLLVRSQASPVISQEMRSTPGKSQASASDVTKLAMYELKRIEQAHPQVLLPTLYLADLALRSRPTLAPGHPELVEGRRVGPVDSTAQDYLERALKITNQTPLKVKILFQLALLHFENNDAKRMGEVLERAHALDPNFVPAANLLALHASSTLGDHERAQRLISTALGKHPRNVHLLDTQATIYANQNKHEQANEIRTALTNKGAKCIGCEILVKK